eukprot:TRINITY_DN405_c0_g1_i1.p1 TRINITY_DN405_c0_g1~~TRINITY_DN405_c0_g1_i1.p1  ORF type:complete len:274 (+),score=72.68 TRINITY_DN405_c0_g1_i1:145-966(+)
MSAIGIEMNSVAPASRNVSNSVNPVEEGKITIQKNSAVEQKHVYQDDDDEEVSPANNNNIAALDVGSGKKSKSHSGAHNAAQESWRLVLMQQNRFIKHGKSGKPKERAISVNTKTGQVTWNGESKGLNVKQLVGTSFGKESRAFKRDWAFKVEASCCLTLHFPSRDVCLQAASKEQAEAYADAIEMCKEYLKAPKQKHGDKVVRSETARRTRQMAEEMMVNLPDRAMSKHMRQERRARSVSSSPDPNEESRGQSRVPSPDQELEESRVQGKVE